ncbi:MAG: hypothetical protein Q9160_004047 [Pyrenula sp. 1 TL-2023]
MGAMINLPILTHTIAIAAFGDKLRKHTGLFFFHHFPMSLNAFGAIILLVTNATSWRLPLTAPIGSCYFGRATLSEKEPGPSIGMIISIYASVVPAVLVIVSFLTRKMEGKGLTRAGLVVVGLAAGTPLLGVVLSQSQALGRPKILVKGPNNEREFSFGQLLPLMLTGSNVIGLLVSYLGMAAILMHLSWMSLTNAQISELKSRLKQVERKVLKHLENQVPKRVGSKVPTTTSFRPPVTRGVGLRA